MKAVRIMNFVNYSRRFLHYCLFLNRFVIAYSQHCIFVRFQGHCSIANELSLGKIVTCRISCHAWPQPQKPHSWRRKSMSKNINSISSHAEGDSDNMTGNERPVLKRRPRVYGELMETTCFRLPKSWIDQIEMRVLKGAASPVPTSYVRRSNTPCPSEGRIQRPQERKRGSFNGRYRLG